VGQFITVLLATTFVGCAAAPTQTVSSIEDLTMLAGTWQGWLVTDRDFNLITFTIHADGAFEVAGPWVRASGLIVLMDGKLRFDGTGPWRGNLVSEVTAGRRVLRVERDDRLYRGTLHNVSPPG
jgi:hypothetical protein